MILARQGWLASDSAADNSTPKRGGTLRIALPTDVTSLDPALAFDTISEPFLLMFQGLVEYDDGTKVVPCLAKDWAVSEGQRIYTFHLRPGVRFSNGREVGGLRFCVYAGAHPRPENGRAYRELVLKGSLARKIFGRAKTPTCRRPAAPREIRWSLSWNVPTHRFLYILTLPGALVVPREAVERFGTSFASHPVGTGPYVLTQWRRGVKMRFERNPLFSQA